jgi:hypothetical protein
MSIVGILNIAPVQDLVFGLPVQLFKDRVIQLAYFMPKVELFTLNTIFRPDPGICLVKLSEER